jgi:hypothetical protein
MTNQERLEQIERAIAAIETGAQEYTIGSRRLRRGDLKVLYEERRHLQAAIAAENGYDTVVAIFDRR